MEDKYLRRLIYEILICSLGNVSENLFFISFSCSNKDSIFLRFHLKENCDLDKELISDIACEFEIYHGDFIKVNYEIAILSESNLENTLLDNVVFGRYEKFNSP